MVGASGVKRSNPKKDENDLIALQSDPNCTQTYRGIYQGATIYIVGYGTDSETLYVRGDRELAIAHARDEKTTLDQVTAGSLCDTVMRELLES